MTQEIIEHPIEDISNLALETIGKLLHSSEIKSHTFTRPLENGGGELAECVVGEPASDGHVLLSTYGTGGVETTGNLQIDSGDKKYPYHAEFFMVASDSPVANVLVEELVNLSFIVSVNKQPLLPGMIISGINGNDEIYYFFTQAPLGIQDNHSAAPLLTSDFALAFVAVNRLYKSEVDLLQTENGLEKLNAFFVSLGNDAYSLGRKQYSEVEEETATTNEEE